MTKGQSLERTHGCYLKSKTVGTHHRHEASLNNSTNAHQRSGGDLLLTATTRFSSNEDLPQEWLWRQQAEMALNIKQHSYAFQPDWRMVLVNVYTSCSDTSTSSVADPKSETCGRHMPRQFAPPQQSMTRPGESETATRTVAGLDSPRLPVTHQLLEQQPARPSGRPEAGRSQPFEKAGEFHHWNRRREGYSMQAASREFPAACPLRLLPSSPLDNGRPASWPIRK